MKKMAFVMALVLLAGSLAGCGAKEGQVTLYVLNWGDYIDDEEVDVIAAFMDKYPNIKVNYSTTASNEEMLVKLSDPNSVYDICFPSDYIIEKMIRDDMLHELNKENIPNLANIDERFWEFSDEFDPGNKYSVPYMWGTVGILYNTTIVQEPVTSWKIFWDETYAGQILMYDSIRDTIGITLKMLGYSINTREEAHVLAAQDALIAQRPLVQAYLGDPIKEAMIRGSGAMAVVYSGDAIWCMEENPDLAFVVPDEGSNVWIDNIIVPKTSKHTYEAELFIDFLCEAEIAKANTEYIGYSSPNKAALELLDPEMLEDETYNPPQEVLDRCEIFHDLGDFIEVYNDAWTKIMAA